MYLSPRRRRRLLWTALAAATTGALVALGILMPNTADQPEASRSNVPAIVNVPRKPVALTPARRQALVSLAKRFVFGAVLRKNPDDAWTISSPALRQGTTREMWQHGSIPVTPYPVTAARWRLRYSYADEARFEVWVASDDANLVPMVFGLTFVRDAPSGSWLVDDWAPSPSSVIDQQPVYRDQIADPLARTERASARTSPLVLLLPVGLLGGGLVLVLATLLGGRRRLSRRIRTL